MKLRKNTILLSVESLLNYCLYFILIYWILPILGLPVSSLLAGAGLLGWRFRDGEPRFSFRFGQWFRPLERQLDGTYVRLTVGSILPYCRGVGIRMTQVRDLITLFIPNRKHRRQQLHADMGKRSIFRCKYRFDKIYQVIVSISPNKTNNSRSVDRSYDFRPDRKNGRYSFRIAMTAQMAPRRRSIIPL